jgi:hypothetical protein
MIAASCSRLRVVCSPGRAWERPCRIALRILKLPGSDNDARHRFDRLLGLRNEVGLPPHEEDPRSKLHDSRLGAQRARCEAAKSDATSIP